MARIPEPGKGKSTVVVAPRPAKRVNNSDTGSSFLGTPARKVAFALIIISVYSILSIFFAARWLGGWLAVTALGTALRSIFSWASYFLPVWAIFLAGLVLSRQFRPRLTYLLFALVLPFLVAAGFARISSEPVEFFAINPMFQAVGLSSLYAGLGFLFALSLLLVAFGWVRLTAYLRSAGLLPEPRDSNPRERAAKDKPRLRKIGAAFAALVQKIKTWLSDRKARRSQAELRLRESETLAATHVKFDLPDLPPISKGSDPLSIGGRSPAVVTGSDPIPAAGAVQTTIDASGIPIEFVSVPPQSVTGTAAGVASADTDGKKALVAKILERKKLKPYSVPVEGILETYPDGQYWIIDDKTRRNAEVLRETLAEFNIEAEVTGIRKGPVITMYEILPAHGVKISKITNLADNIALRLAASSVRIVAPIPGKHAVGIEVPNERRSIVSLKEMIEHEKFKTAKMEIPVVLGKDIAGEVQFTDLNQAPHILIAGATGSGKSVCVNALILSILYRRSPEEVKLIMIDPKIVELKLYNDIPHLLTPVITDPKRAFQALQYCICEMEKRYSMLDKAGVRDIRAFNRGVKDHTVAQEKLPYIVVIIDEFADLMATTGKELEDTLRRIAAMSRAVGIHLVLATQRPSVDVITGLIKANIPSRIAFMVASKFDSRVIIDMVGAEKLLGRGDMLYAGSQDPFPVRMQGAFVSDEEVMRAVKFVKTLGEPDYIDDEIFYDEEEEGVEPGLFDDGEGDPLFEKALEIVLQQGKASASFIQRRLKIGYNRSARIVELMEERGIVGPSQGSKPRDVVRNPEVFGHPDAGRSPAAERATKVQEE